VNGTVRIEKWTVTRSGKSTKITGPVTTQEKREILRRQARAMLNEQSSSVRSCASFRRRCRERR